MPHAPSSRVATTSPLRRADPRPDRTGRTRGAAGVGRRGPRGRATAHAARIRLLPQGANTGLVGSSVSPADDPVTVLSLDLLGGTPDVDPVGATATVNAGTRLSALNEAAARHGLQLPIDLRIRSGDRRDDRNQHRRQPHAALRADAPLRAWASRSLPPTPTRRCTAGRAGVRKDSSWARPGTASPSASGGTLGVITRDGRARAAAARHRDVVARRRRPADAARRCDLARPAPAGLVTRLRVRVPDRDCERTLSAPGARPNPFGDGVPAASVLAEWSFGDDRDDDVTRPATSKPR